MVFGNSEVVGIKHRLTSLKTSALPVYYLSVPWSHTCTWTNLRTFLCAWTRSRRTLDLGILSGPLGLFIGCTLLPLWTPLYCETLGKFLLFSWFYADIAPGLAWNSLEWVQSLVQQSHIRSWFSAKVKKMVSIDGASGSNTRKLDRSRSEIR